MAALSNTTASSILINAGGVLDVSGPYTTVAGWLGSGVISPSSSGILALSGSDNETLNLSSSGYGGLGLGAVAAGATYSGSLTPTGTTYRLGGGAGTLTYAPNIGGAYGLAVGNSLILTGSASYTGPTTISSGTLQLANASNQTLSGNISGNGGLAWAGGATLTLTGSNAYTGSTTISSGTLLLGNAAAAQNSTVTVSATNGLAFTPGIGTFNVGGLSGNQSFVLADTGGGGVNLSIGGNNANTTYSGVMSGSSGSLTKVGSGTLTLSNENTYGGGTTVNGGTLVLNSGNGSGYGTIVGVLNINPGAVVELGRTGCVGLEGESQSERYHRQHRGRHHERPGQHPGLRHQLRPHRRHHERMNSSGQYDGGQYHFSGNYGVTTLASSATSLIGGEIDIRGTTVVFNVASGTAPGGVDLNVSAQLIDSGEITKSGPGLMVLSNSNNNWSSGTGQANINGGTLQLGDGVANNGSVPGAIVNNAMLTFANPNPQTYGLGVQTISGSGSLIMSGPSVLTLVGTNTFTGVTKINGGTLARGEFRGPAR